MTPTETMLAKVEALKAEDLAMLLAGHEADGIDAWMSRRLTRLRSRRFCWPPRRFPCRSWRREAGF